MKKWYAVIGDPIAQSMSPEMHGQWFSEAGIDAAYLPILVKQNEVAEAADSLRRLGCSGYNVTVPHKTDILPLLGKVDRAAKLMNAVNTVYIDEEGTLCGANTDGPGFVRSLEEAYGTEGKGKKLLIIGAGGAARGISFALKEAGYGPIYIANRTAARAASLCGELTDAIPLTYLEAEDMMGQFGLIVQTTSVGMRFAQMGVPLSCENLTPCTIVADIIYNPLETEFLAAAKQAGARTLNGVGMFVHQGALAFEKWTGVYPDTASMIRTIHQKLGGTLC